jgi:hypothetical protein
MKLSTVAGIVLFLEEWPLWRLGGSALISAIKLNVQVQKAVEGIVTTEKH